MLQRVPRRGGEATAGSPWLQICIWPHARVTVRSMETGGAGAAASVGPGCGISDCDAGCEASASSGASIFFSPSPNCGTARPQVQELVENGIPGEVKRIAGVVDMAGERGGTLTPKRKGYRKQIKSVERGRR